MKTKRIKYTSRNLKALRIERKAMERNFTSSQRALLEAMRDFQVNPTIEYLREEFGSDYFANITLDAQHNRLTRAYNEVDVNWRAMSNVVPVNDFKLQHAVAASGFNDLDTVLENGTYQVHRIEDEDRGTYSLVKRGNIFGLTLEAQANDTLNAFGRKMQAEGQAAARTLDKFCITTNLSSNPTIYDSVSLIDAAHNNVVGALSEANLKAAIQLMKTQTGIKSDEQIELKPHTLIVNPADEFEARSLLESKLMIGDGNIPDKNTLMGMIPNLIVTVRMAVNFSVLLANPSQVDMFELGFFRGNESPETFTEDPGSPAEFDTDVNRWKVRHIYSGAWRDFRGVVGLGAF